MLAASHNAAHGDAFEHYALVRTFELPDAAGSLGALGDGRVITLVTDQVYVETVPGSGDFGFYGSLPDANLPSYGAAFLRVSPDGTKIAVGNNGGDESSPPDFQVGVFDVASLTGTWFTAGHFDAAWVDNTHLAVTAGDFAGPSFVTALDTTSADPANPTNPVVVNNIGGASGGIAFDNAGNLYTSNGFSFIGPSGTGATKAFENAVWTAALSGGPVPDFEFDGTLVVDVLSASPLAFDVEGNLLVAGGDLYGSGEGDFVAIVHSSAVARALAGLGAADPNDPSEVRRLDPDAVSSSNFYWTAYNPATRELYVRDFGDATVYVFMDATGIPAASQWGIAVLALLLTTAASLLLRPRPMLDCSRRTSTSNAGTHASPIVRGSSQQYPLALMLPLLLVLQVSPAFGNSPFASTVIEYSPAPGQFVNNGDFNNPQEALGPPQGAGTAQMSTSSLVSLGGFGGSITLAFDHVVTDDPLNPYGIDAIVFGNAVWVGGNPNAHWAECATIEIALDTNKNGRIEDGENWYLIPGSHIRDPAAQFSVQTWDDDPHTATPPELPSWIPAGRSGTWSTSAYELPREVFASWIVTNPDTGLHIEGIFGYAEYTPTLILGDMDADNTVDDSSMSVEEFYTTPDDPYAIGITPGSGGGDGFDIAWAIDPSTGSPAHLPGFNFIRLKNGVNAVIGVFGEKSPEIDALADVAPDPFGDIDGDGDIDLADVALFQQCFGQTLAAAPACAAAERNGDGRIDWLDAAAFILRLMGPI